MRALAQVPLAAPVIAAFGAGGMPTNGTGARRHIGHGVGCTHLLDHGVFPDMAIIAKPGLSVSWEEVGLAWFDIVVPGTHTYVGARHRIDYRSAVADAGRLAAALDAWFPHYAKRHTDGLVAPQGVVSFISGGNEHSAGFPPASCRIRVDMRLSPRTTPSQARHELTAAVAELAPDLDVIITPVLSIPGHTTAADHPVCTAARAAYEAVEQRPHVDYTEMSGSTDANVLRRHGIPTVRVGMPKVLVDDAEPDFALGMNIASIDAMERFTRLLIHVAIHLCGAPGDAA
jgi:succinyl-diaminopimelate desuccinylase